MRHESVRGHADFRRLWTGLTLSQLGSAVGLVALPVVAVKVVGASPAQVSLLATFAAVATALVALPLGSFVEYRRKRPVMILADVVRFASVGSIPIAYALHRLTFVQLCVVGVVNAVGQIAFVAASGAHLKTLVPAPMLVDANARLQSATWANISAGPVVGGFLVALLTAPFTLLVDSVSFLADAVIVRRIRSPEPVPATRDPARSRLADVAGGLRFVWRHRTLRPILASWLLYAGSAGMLFPLLTYFYLHVLRFSNLEYGLLMGIPSLGGVIGARLTTRLVARFGSLRTMRWTALLRSPWTFVIAVASPGAVGLALCGVAFGAQLFASSISNSAMASYRQLETPQDLMARVGVLWTFVSTVAQPVFLLLGSLLAATFEVRVGIVVAASLMALSAFLLPWSRRSGEPPPAPV